MSLSPRQLMGWGRQTLLTVGAVLGTLCVLVAAASALFGVRPLVFESGSMSPTITTGALAISRDVAASDLRVGDIVSVPTGTGERVTHRIVTVTQRGNLADLALKGDANEDADARVYEVTHADRVLFDVPKLGYVISWLVGPVGLFLLGLYAAFLLSIVLRREPNQPGPPMPPADEAAAPPATPRPARVKGGSRRATKRSAPNARTLVRTLSLLAALGILTASAFPFRAVTTLAAWSESVPVSGTNLTAYTVPAPVIASCVNTPAGTTSLRHVTLTWPGVTSPGTSYTASASGITVTSAVVSGTTTRTVDIAYAPTSANQNKLVNVTLTPELTATATWKGPADTWPFRTPASTGQATCGETVAPTAGFTAPDGTTRTASAMQTYMSGAGGCANTARAACGTMSDGSTISNVDFILQRVQSGVTLCWDGATYVSNCTTWRTGTIASTTTWRVPGSNATVYNAPGGSFNIQVRVTDTWGNQTTITRSFTVTP